MGLLDGKVAVVTGAGHGVGRGHAVQLAAAGAKVVVNDLGGSPSGEGADKTVAQEVVEVIKERGGDAIADANNVASFEGAKEMIDKAIDGFGRLDILVNNAGILRDRMIFNMAESDWDAVINVHLKGHFAPTRHACEYWRNQSKAGENVTASIVHTSSSVGLLGNVGQTNYAAAKGGIAMFSIAVGQDMQRYGVRSNCIAPSGSTRLLPGAGDEVLEPDQYTEWLSTDPGNVGPLVVWLASDLVIEHLRPDVPEHRQHHDALQSLVAKCRGNRPGQRPSLGSGRTGSGNGRSRVLHSTPRPFWRHAVRSPVSPAQSNG